MEPDTHPRPPMGLVSDDDRRAFGIPLLRPRIEALAEYLTEHCSWDPTGPEIVDHPERIADVALHWVAHVDGQPTRPTDTKE